MNWTRIERNWEKLRGSIQRRWGALTNEQLDVIAGRRECLAWSIQRSYGITRDEAEKQLGAWQIQQKLNVLRMQYGKSDAGPVFHKSGMKTLPNP